MWLGEPKQRVKLHVDLTRYHAHLVPGVEGVLVPMLKTTPYGIYDRFGAVRYDCCGHTMDTLFANLEML